MKKDDAIWLGTCIALCLWCVFIGIGIGYSQMKRWQDSWYAHHPVAQSDYGVAVESSSGEFDTDNSLQCKLIRLNKAKNGEIKSLMCMWYQVKP